MADEVGRMLAEDPALIHARGGDGKLPLHYAQTVDMAEYLVSRGADINARDIDHESTAAQYMVRDRQPVARFLVRRGASADLLMAAALGDVELTRRLLDGQPSMIRMRVTVQWFPMRDARAGGTIYIWTLGGGKGAHEIAQEFGHEDVLGILLSCSPASLKLAIACESGDERLARDLRAEGATIEPLDHGRLVAAASRGQTAAARRLLDAGCAAAAIDEGATALHWAAYHGNADLVAVLLQHAAPTDVRDARFDGTPRDWAEHGARESRPHPGADYARVIELLRQG
jgi:ankyrin repeat protein